MVDFSHIAKAMDTTGRERWFSLPGVHALGKPMKLKVCCATDDSNPKHRAAQMAYRDELGKHTENGKITPEFVAAARIMHRDLYPIHVILGWDNVLAPDGKPIPFSIDYCKQLFDVEIIKDEVLDAISEYCSDATNFYEGVQITNSEGMVGNSDSASDGNSDSDETATQS